MNRPSMGIDGEHCGNEMRFINSAYNMGESNNCKMSIVYCDTYPRVMIVVTRNIAVGEEILMDYGEAYNSRYLAPMAHNQL